MDFGLGTLPLLRLPAHVGAVKGEAPAQDAFAALLGSDDEVAHVEHGAGGLHGVEEFGEGVERGLPLALGGELVHIADERLAADLAAGDGDRVLGGKAVHLAHPIGVDLAVSLEDGHLFAHLLVLGLPLGAHVDELARLGAVAAQALQAGEALAPGVEPVAELHGEEAKGHDEGGGEGEVLLVSGKAHGVSSPSAPGIFSRIVSSKSAPPVRRLVVGPLVS